MTPAETTFGSSVTLYELFGLSCRERDESVIRVVGVSE
jgi:hypothetical protein